MNECMSEWTSSQSLGEGGANTEPEVRPNWSLRGPIAIYDGRLPPAAEDRSLKYSAWLQKYPVLP